MTLGVGVGVRLGLTALDWINPKMPVTMAVITVALALMTAMRACGLPSLLGLGGVFLAIGSSVEYGFSMR
jgi:hypothetical protein